MIQLILVPIVLAALFYGAYVFVKNFKDKKLLVRIALKALLALAASALTLLLLVMAS